MFLHWALKSIYSITSWENNFTLAGNLKNETHLLKFKSLTSRTTT